MKKSQTSRMLCQWLALILASPALAASPTEALDRCLAGTDRATGAVIALPPAERAAHLPVLAGQDSGCIGTALSACTINRFTTASCIDEVTHLMQTRLARAIASHPVEEDRPDALRAPYGHWLTAPPAPCDPKLAGGDAICTALGLGSRLIEARTWARRFDLEAQE